MSNGDSENNTLTSDRIINLLKEKGVKTVFVGEQNQPVFFDTCYHEAYGNIFAIDNNIFFIHVWSNDFLMDVYQRLGDLLYNEIVSRGIRVEDAIK